MRLKKKIGSGSNARTQKIRLDPTVQSRYAQVRQHVQYAAQRYNIDEHYLAGLMYLESVGFQPNAQSPSGAAGLGQFTRGTFRDVVRRSSHPELQALTGLSDNQLMLQRLDPRLNTLATAEYVGQAYQGLKRGFTRYGIHAEPTRAELYSFHNTGNAGIAIAARQGLTVGQAPIMNDQQKAQAIRWNPSLYSNGMQTPAAEYMRRVEEKLDRGTAYAVPPAQLHIQVL